MSELRVTRQVVEVLGQHVGNLQVASQVVEVVGVPISQVQVVGLTVEVLRSVQPARNLQSLIELSQSVTVVVRQPVRVTSDLPFNQSVTYEKRRRATYSLTASSSIAFVQSPQYIGPKNAAGSSFINITDSARIPQNYPLSADTILAFSTANLSGGSKRLAVASSLTLTSIGDSRVKLRSVGSSIEWSQSASFDKIIKTASTISFSQVLRIGSLLSKSYSTIDFSQTARVEPQPQSVTDTLEFSQQVWQNIRNLEAYNFLEPEQSITVLKPYHVEAVSQLSTTDIQVVDSKLVEVDTGLRQWSYVYETSGYSTTQTFPISQSASVTKVSVDGLPLVVGSLLQFTHNARLSLTAEAFSTLDFSQVSLESAGRPGTTQLEFLQTAVGMVQRGIPIPSAIEFYQSVTYSIEFPDVLSEYTPFVGESSDPDAPAPPPRLLSEPLSGISVPFQLVYPSIGAVTDMVALKNPRFGNLDRLAFNRILRETRGGHLIVFADPIWPKKQTLSLSFSGLFEWEIKEYLRFAETHLGQEIGLIDWEHRYWRGIIITPNEPIVEDAFDSFSVTFEFQGEMDPTWNPSLVPVHLRYSPIRTPMEDGYYVPAEPLLPVASMADQYVAEAAQDIRLGNALHMGSDGFLGLAVANSPTMSRVIGLALMDALTGSVCTYATEGSVERVDWTEVAGVEFLLAGSAYFLNPVNPGRITSSPPVATGQYVVYLGRATSQTALDLEIEAPILL